MRKLEKFIEYGLNGNKVLDCDHVTTASGLENLTKRERKIISKIIKLMKKSGFDRISIDFSVAD